MPSTLLFCPLFQKAREGENCELRVLIPTALVGKLLGHWQCQTVSEGENYAVRFIPRAVEGKADAKEGDQK